MGVEISVENDALFDIVTADKDFFTCSVLFIQPVPSKLYGNDNWLYVDNWLYLLYAILPGFQLELGRSIQDFKEALKETRLPVIIKKLIERGETNYTLYTTPTPRTLQKILLPIPFLL